jgi:hypothetical protein
MTTRKFWPAAVLCLVALPFCAGAQAPAPAAGLRAPKKHPDPSAFVVLPWLSFEPTGSSLIRTREQMDLAAREDQTYITVFGRKQRPDVGPRRDDVYTPTTSEAAIPWDLPEQPPNSCSNGAYNTVAGQAATGGDLMGYLGGGRC